MNISSIRENNALKTSIIIWFTYAFLYMSLKQQYPMGNYAGYLALIGQSGLDLIALLILGIILYRKLNALKNKICIILWISYFAAFIADATYNYFLNVRMYELTAGVDLVFDLPFLIFISLQMLFFDYILFRGISLDKYNIIFSLPYILVSGCIFSIFIYGISWQIKTNSIFGIIHLLDSVIECLGFIFALICMTLSIGRWLKYLGAGYCWCRFYYQNRFY